MEPNELFEMALQLPGNWKVVRHAFSGQPRRLELWLDFPRGSKFADPRGGELCPVHDTVEKSWRHLNSGSTRRSCTHGCRGLSPPRAKCAW